MRDIEIDADKPTTTMVCVALVLLLIRVPIHLAQWVEGSFVVSRSVNWGTYMVFPLALWILFRAQHKGIRILSALVAAVEGIQIALQVTHASATTWRTAAPGISFLGMLLEVGLLVGIAIWFKERVRFAKSPDNA